MEEKDIQTDINSPDKSAILFGEKNIIFYTVECPKCKVLEIKLERKNIAYSKCTDLTVMLGKGIKAAPALEVDGTVLDFAAAVKWVNEQE